MNSLLPWHRRRLLQAVASKGTDVTLTWTEYTGSAIDPVTGARTGATVNTVYRAASGRPDAVPGMVGAIQTFGQLIHWHPLDGELHLRRPTRRSAGDNSAKLCRVSP